MHSDWRKLMRVAGMAVIFMVASGMPAAAQVLENPADHVAYYDVSTHYATSADGYGGVGVTGGAGDNLIRLTAVNSSGNGYGLCANIYVFDNTGTMEECCSCQVPPNSMRALSVIANLTSNPSESGHNLGAGTIRVVATSILNGPTTDCAINNASIITSSIEGDLEPEILSGWITHTESNATNNPPNYDFLTGVSSEHLVFQQALDVADLSAACKGILNGQQGACSCQ
jgi:hypothetical protein